MNKDFPLAPYNLAPNSNLSIISQIPCDTTALDDSMQNFCNLKATMIQQILSPPEIYAPPPISAENFVTPMLALTFLAVQLLGKYTRLQVKNVLQ